MAKINTNITLKHQPNLGEDTVEIVFEVGSEVTILKEWRHHYFCKDDDGGYSAR